VIFLGKGLDGRVLSIVISSVTIGITSYIILTQKSTFSNGFSKIKDCLAFSLPIIPSSYSMLIIILSDRIILERYVEWAELGIYTVAFSLTNLISLFTQSLYKSIEPYIFNNIENNNFKSRFLEVRKAYLFVISTVTLAFIVFINDFIQIFFDNKYIESSKFSGTLAIGTLLFGFYLIYTPILIALKKQKIIFSTSIIAAVLNVAINLILIPIIGVYGAIFSSIFSFFVISFVAIIYVRKFYIKINYLDELFILIALSVMATFVTFANDFMSNYTYFIVKIILFSIVFCLLTLGLGVFKSIKTLLKSQA
jgi:O-antigen/teichoic acid export membrane protein